MFTEYVQFSWSHTCKWPFAGRHCLLWNALVLAGLCGMFNLWELFNQLVHEHLQREMGVMQWQQILLNSESYCLAAL